MRFHLALLHGVADENRAVGKAPGATGIMLLLLVAGAICERSCEATESALVHTLHYITRHLSYEISDLEFTKYSIRFSQ